MADQYSQVRSIADGSAIQNVIGGMIFGLIFLIIASGVLWWNESSSASNQQDIEEGLAVVRILDKPVVEVQNNNALVSVYGPVMGAELTDPLFGVSSKAIALYRQVEMYQWKEITEEETHKKSDGTTETITSYRYEKDWNRMEHNSKLFKHPEGHENPPLNYHAETYKAKSTLGEFQLSDNLISEAEGYQTLNLSQVSSTIPNSQVFRGVLYISESPMNPKIGDYKIKYYITPSGQNYSIIAKQDGKVLIPYTTDGGNSLSFMKLGMHTPQELFAQVQADNEMWTWIIRAGGLFGLFIAFFLMMSPLQAFAAMIPVVGPMLTHATLLIALLLTALYGGLVIALAWFVQRPLVLLIIFAVIAFLIFKAKKHKPAAIRS